MSDSDDLPLFASEPAPPAWTTVAQVGDIAEGQGKAIAVGKRMIAVFLHQGKYYAIDDFCPHQGASLAEGYIADCTIACPWHHWRFSLADGTWVDNPKLGVDCYPVRAVGQEIQVQVE